ncbi:45247_t:CDS:2 [Gigaspora margarita]|uniref:45247_t:CDS:1 n=1 Tax=Gigaspora margarita TaxID=4874 RepID=A0ABN7UF62_GIGMA|nr:45247_t:CDS:2 [Gigaspora margarita]
MCGFVELGLFFCFTNSITDRTTYLFLTHSSRISVYTDESEIPEDSFNDFNMHCNDEKAVAEKMRWI